MAPSLIEPEPLHAANPPLKPQETIASSPSLPHEEYQYLNLIREILKDGEHRPDRTGTGTYSLFAPSQLKFSLSAPTGTPILPLLTTKRVFVRAVLTELLWFISGSTSSVPLSAAGIKIWDGNGSRAYLDSVGLTDREEGDLGPVYGFQWRHFGATYIDSKTDYNGQGIDQLAEVMHKLRHSPHDRRIILSAWNPADLKKMALPPCHMFAQFYVSFPSARRGAHGAKAEAQEESEPEPEPEPGAQGQQTQTQPLASKPRLHCQLYQRSCDMGLGVPFNIASYALLTHMLAHACDLAPGTLTHVMGDAHVYVDHVDALKVQLEREPRPFPALEILRERGGGDGGDGGGAGVGAGAGAGGIDGWKVEDFVVSGYEPHKGIVMKMSV